jgi:F-type H+-transporting ATPase subunit a
VATDTSAVAAAEASGGGSGFDPMKQFEIVRLKEFSLFGLDVSFTNSALYMIFAIVLVSAVMLLGSRKAALVPSRMQSITELSYEFVANMVRDNAGSEGLKYFPFIFTLFMFILASNMIGMVPYTFTTTSQIVVTFSLAAVVFIGVTVIGFIRHGLGFFGLFVPSGVPKVMLVILVPIELISYLTRPISLSVRLFANMMAGHTMFKVFAGFVISLGVVGGWLPLGFMVALTGLEVLIAFLQAYVFAILSCIYLNEALHLH